MLSAADNLVASPEFKTITFQEGFTEIDKDWAQPPIWRTLKLYAPKYTSGYFLNSVDMKLTPDGMEARPANERIYITLFQRTLSRVRGRGYANPLLMTGADFRFVVAEQTAATGVIPGRIIVRNSNPSPGENAR